jgi:hypothetical protein
VSDDWVRKMKRVCLTELSKRDVSIPASWSTVSVYDALVSDGTARPVINVAAWMKAYTITKEGIRLLQELGGEVSLQDVFGSSDHVGCPKQ